MVIEKCYSFSAAKDKTTGMSCITNNCQNQKFDLVHSVNCSLHMLQETQLLQHKRWRFLIIANKTFNSTPSHANVYEQWISIITTYTFQCYAAREPWPVSRVHYVTNTSLSLAEWPRHLTTATNDVAVPTTCFCTRRRITLHTVCMIRKKSKYHTENLRDFPKKEMQLNKAKIFAGKHVTVTVIRA